MNFLLRNLTWYTGTRKVTGHVRITRGKITALGDLQKQKDEAVFDFENHFLYPGLINAHDHLEMNLYPKLGNPPYANYLEWSSDIYKPLESPIREIEKVNIKDRLMWGGLKNIISGVTTVIHHNPWNSILQKKEFPVMVLKKMAWSHSLGLDKKIIKSFPKNSTTPFIIHAGEGIDETTLSEIPKLNSLGFLKKNTIIIHGVTIDEEQIALLKARGSSLVWCPSSNLFMFGQTAPIHKLRGNIRLALGTDSTLTGSPTLLDELRVASDTNLATPAEIMDMVTLHPSIMFNLPLPRIENNSIANFFVTPVIHDDYYENLLKTQAPSITMVFVQGKLRLLDSRMNLKKSKLHSFSLAGHKKLMDLDVPSLRKKILKKVSEDILESNPLWRLIGD